MPKDELLIQNCDQIILYSIQKSLNVPNLKELVFKVRLRSSHSGYQGTYLIVICISDIIKIRVYHRTPVLWMCNSDL